MESVCIGDAPEALWELSGSVRSTDPGNVSSKGSNVEALQVAQTGESTGMHANVSA
jgi:hypothetical protein